MKSSYKIKSFSFTPSIQCPNHIGSGHQEAWQQRHHGPESVATRARAHASTAHSSARS